MQANDSGLASYVAGQIDRTLSWKDVQWLQTITTMQILVKGVITAEDTRLAIQAGAAGIIVSNHGARQLDYIPATIMALEEVTRLIYTNSGVAVLALGANAVHKLWKWQKNDRNSTAKLWNTNEKEDLQVLVVISRPPVKMDQRAMSLMIDPGLYENKKSDIFWVQPNRPLPTAFKLFID